MRLMCRDLQEAKPGAVFQPGGAAAANQQRVEKGEEGHIKGCMQQDVHLADGS